MSSATLGDIVMLVLITAAACSAAWVLRDALNRGLPGRKALTWAALQWIEFPLFLWLYCRIRPKGRRRQAPDGRSVQRTAQLRTPGD